MTQTANFGKAVRIGLIAGVVALSVSAIGMVQSFDVRDIITGVLTLGQLLLFGAALLAGYFSWQKGEGVAPLGVVLRGLTAGLLTAVPVIALIFLTIAWPGIRTSFVNVSPALIEILTFGQEPVTGSLILLAVMGVLGVLGAAFDMLPQRIQKPLLYGLLWTLCIGLLSEILLLILRPYAPRGLLSFLFGAKGITPVTAVLIFILATVGSAWWAAQGQGAMQQRRATMSPSTATQLRRLNIGLLIIFILMLPIIMGTYLTEVANIVGTFILMGLGLNIVVGFAGLLDLGYVAFFAIGAYVMGLLTTEGHLGIGGLSFWTALPFSVLAATTAGIILGIPVLRMRGDYLAIVTLGFGEIIRVLVVSDLLKPYIGGAQGILQIGRPQIGSFVFVQPQHFYYLILAGCLLAAFVSWRFRDARLGRQWMALREDEDVAEAMGIRLVSTKLMAFATGAAFSGLAGAIFAARLSSIFPHSFNLLISINVLSLIIVGGLGSLPGVVVGALVLVGLPELLREFAEYRMLLYGALLIVTMLLRPEGLWPSPIRRRELHEAEEMAHRHDDELEEASSLA
ncbi:MAG: leucine/isoleucine/valine transporter permease subunit [Chloroflexi bacterium]|nr:leucine/isoleucine/valine transporter permease subunit [Chloroflexota bacterium]